MSLPDTVFIFVLALIIFGPKKLPEIGRQIGRLVGEFRRASNEFKFQIEEELRQADRTDTPKTQNTIAAPGKTGSPEDADLSLTDVQTDDLQNEFSLSDSVAAGQRPNPDAMQEVVDSTSVHEPEGEWAGHEVFAESKMPVSLATITAAVGAQARKTAPYVPVAEVATPPAAAESTAVPAPEEAHRQNGSSSDAPPVSLPEHSASPEAEIHHG